MKKTFLTLILAVASAFFVTACGKREEPVAKPVQTVEQQRAEALAKSAENAKLQDLLEQQRATALTNATVNASSYFAANPRFDSKWKIMPHTDDQISPACPQGSGWAWVNIMRVEGKEIEKKKLWCSTSSSSLGCYIEDDFTKGPYAHQAQSCDPNLPHPLKPLAK